MQIEKKPETEIPQRAPLEREAPLPLDKPSVSVLKNNLFKNKKLHFTDSTGFQGGPSARRKGYKLALWSWLASFIDILLLISASSIFVIAFSYIMKTSPNSVFSELLKSQHKTTFFFEVFFVVGWVYTICIRNLMGSTIGEWSCDLRLGQPHERLHSSYIFRVALRSTLIFLTGVVTLPFLSLIFGKDVAGIASGLKLFSLK
ncbi:MAG: RDD family protein [Bdellovibrio sp.]